MTTLPAWWDGPADGPTNMAADECLGDEAVVRGGPVVRVYGWSTTTVSLGGFQRIAEARSEPAIAGAALVRRPSGGGAIVHGSDLTYAVAVPRDHALGGRPQALYTAFHAALVDVLAELGSDARLCPAGTPAPGGVDAFFCFDRRAEGDVVVTVPGQGMAAAKVLGSAQRRLAAAVVQHGSLLLHSAGDVGPAARHPGLSDLLPAVSGLPPRDLVDRWLARVARGLGGRTMWESEGFRRGREDRISCLAATFAAPRWLERR